MKEIFSAFEAEVFRPLVTVVIPGAIGISCWFVAVMQRCAQVRDLVSGNHTETTVLLTVVCIASGLIIEDLGSRIESSWFDTRLVKQDGFSGHKDDWNRYLRIAFKLQPVGQDYLRTILLRFKFETGVALGLLSSSIGLFFTDLKIVYAASWSALLVAAAVYLLSEARCSHRLLSEIRREILKGVLIYGSV